MNPVFPSLTERKFASCKPAATLLCSHVVVPVVAKNRFGNNNNNTNRRIVFYVSPIPLRVLFKEGALLFDRKEDPKRKLARGAV